MEFIPSYKNYQAILNDILASGKYCDYWEAAVRSEFIILRHDIEFSVERAYRLSQIESENKICSTYFVQITNNAYNAFSQQNRNLIMDMRARGHHIGLHFHLNGVTDPLKVRDGIRDQLRILSEMYGFQVDRFSLHRPVREVGYNNIPIEGIINAYAPEFFTLVDSVDDMTRLDVKYIADSQQRWNYGFPDGETFRRYPKIQLLIHPDFWTDGGAEERDNFTRLINENTLAYINTLDSECKHFSKHKVQLQEELNLA